MECFTVCEYQTRSRFCEVSYQARATSSSCRRIIDLVYLSRGSQYLQLVFFFDLKAVTRYRLTKGDPATFMPHAMKLVILLPVDYGNGKVLAY